MRWTRCVVLLFAGLVPAGIFSQSDMLDSLLRVLPTKSGAERVRALGDVQWELGFSDPEKALAYGNEAMKLAEGLKDSTAIAQAANDLSISEYRLGHFQRSIELNKRALTIRMVLNDTLGVAASHSKIGAAFTELLRLDSALVHNYAAERIYEQRGDLSRAAQIRGNLARLYQQMGNIDMALKVSRGTVAMLRPVGDDLALANALGQLSMILFERKEWQETEQVSKEAMDLFNGLGSKADVASLANILGQIHEERGDHVAGTRYLRQALQLSTEVGDLIGQATFMTTLADVLTKQGELREALLLYRRALAISYEEGYVDQRMGALAGYVTALEKSGDPAGALDQQKLLQHLRDSLFKKERLDAMSELQVKYETERTEKELAQERERTLEQRASIARQRLLIGAISGAVLLVALLAWVLIARQRNRLRAERDAAVIAERERGSKATLDRTDAERKRIATELHDGVGQQLTGLKFRLEDVAARISSALPAEAERIKEVLDLAEETGRDVRGIAHSMMPRALGELGLAPALNDMFNRSLARPGVHHAFEHFGLDGRLPAHVEVGVYRIAQELVSNILKHADARNVNVQLLKNGNNLVLIVEDDGRGLDGMQGKGMGMLNMHERARIMHGHIEFTDGPVTGTVATLRVPLTNGNLT